MHLVHVLFRAALTAGLALALGGCSSALRSHSAFALSSMGSDYSPQLRATVSTAVTAESVVVHVDGGRLLAPGEVAPTAHALMRGLTIEALLVGVAATTSEGAPLPWRSLVESESHLIADSLLIGVARAIAPLRFALTRPAGLDPASSWLVFRLRATGVATPVRLADGTLLPGRDVKDGVRVYACSERNLSGAIDRRRARKMRASYLAAC